MRLAQFGFGPGRTNANPSEPTPTPASVAHLVTSWSTACECDPDASRDQPLIAGGLVSTSEFSPGDDNPPRDVTLRARDLAPGAERWSVSVGGGWDRAVAGGVIIVVTNNTLQAFSLSTGAAAGTSQTVPGFDPQVVAGDGRIVVTNGMGLHVLAPSG